MQGCARSSGRAAESGGGRLRGATAPAQPVQGLEPLVWTDGVFDSTLGFPGEGPQVEPATGGRGETVTLLSANVTSWHTAVAAGTLCCADDFLLLQETRADTPEHLRSARAEARRKEYWGRWTPANRLAARGAASGGLCTLMHNDRPFRPVEPVPAPPHWLEGRWAHVAARAGGTNIHIFNVYGWPTGTRDVEARQSALWLELFTQVAALGSAPWVIAGDWNATPDRVWAHVLSPRVGGFLPGPAVREPTCCPSQGAPSELDFFLLSRSLRNAVDGYEYFPVGQLPTHRAVRLTLRLQGLIDMVPTLRRPRAIAPLLQRQQDQPEGPLAAVPPWGRPLQLGPSAQASWDRWTRRAEQWLLSAAGVPLSPSPRPVCRQYGCVLRKHAGDLHGARMGV